MRPCLVLYFVVGLSGFAASQTAPVTLPTASSKPGDAAASAIKDLFEAKIKAEWEAVKNKDKKAYGAMLADDYQGVEVDGRGERNKIQSITDLDEQHFSLYTLWGLKVISSSPDSAFIVYEVTIQYPPGAQIRFTRVYVGELWVKRDAEWKLVHYQETHVK